MFPILTWNQFNPPSIFKTLDVATMAKELVQDVDCCIGASNKQMYLNVFPQQRTYTSIRSTSDSDNSVFHCNIQQWDSVSNQL